MDLQECLEKRYLQKVQPAEDLINKELTETDYDLKSAEKAFNGKDYKWCIIKSYYSMFHAARSLLFKLGFREKRHFAIVVVLEQLNKEGKIESKYVNYFNAALSSREDADYNYIYPRERAEYCLLITKEFLKEMERLVNKI